MRIAVCVKQVPDTTEIKIDPVKNTLIRKGVPNILNPFDLHALELALELKDTYGATVTVFSMGPQQAKEVLREALAMGADEVYLITDRKFGGSDTFATSHILSTALSYKGPFDLVLGGKQAIDGDTGQTASSIAEHLGWPRIGQVLSIEIEGNRVHAKRQIEEGVEVVEATLPLVCTAIKETNKPRYATIKSTLDSLEAEIPEITFEDIKDLVDETKIGLKGSPTKVKKSFVPERNAHGVFLEGAPKEKAHHLLEELHDAKLIS